MLLKYLIVAYSHLCLCRVVSHYAADSLSYVPVQDVVRAFKKDFNVDISYKECHQMILSAFTSPRNRLIPRKTVRVSSIGQQYVYRGIAPLNKATSSSEEAQVLCIAKLVVLLEYSPEQVLRVIYKYILLDVLVSSIAV